MVWLYHLCLDFRLKGDPVVAIYMQPGPELIAAVLGTWLALAAWTPLDRKCPPGRLQQVLTQMVQQDMKPSAVLCDDQTPFKLLSTRLDLCLVDASQLVFDHASDSLNIGSMCLNRFEESLERVAQVIYTSGSTGTPKGVIYTHARLAHSTHFFAEQCEITSETKILNKTPNIWAVFRHEVYPALCRGALIIHPDGGASDPANLAKVISSTSVSVLVARPKWSNRMQQGHLECHGRARGSRWCKWE